MEKRRIGLALVLCTTLFGVSAAANGDEPGPTAHHARTKKKAAKPPKAATTCSTDADCAFTPYTDGGCCPTLCQPRAVTKTSAEALEKYAASCAKQNGRECPELACAPPAIRRQPACISGKCEARAAPGPTRE